MRNRPINPSLILGGIGGVLIASLVPVLWITVARSGSHHVTTLNPEPDPLVAMKRPELEQFVQENAKSKDPVVQDRVGNARIRIGYAVSKAGDFKAARATFQTAVKEYKGTGQMGADFGGVPDQAAYQAAACLMAEHKDDEAKKELVRFMKEYPFSPLVHGAHKRLLKLAGTGSVEDYNTLLQEDIAKQEKRIRFETSVCGPKTIEYLLPKLGKSATDYKKFAQLCGTTDDGTTFEGMRNGLSALGIRTYAYRLSRKDLAKAPMPAIALAGDHYIAVLKVDGNAMTTYDTRYKAEGTQKLPALDDPDFALNAILFSQPEISHK